MPSAPSAAPRPAILIIGSRDGLFRAGRTLARFFNERIDDPEGARDIINGDVAKNGARIAGYHRIFLACLTAAMLPPGSAMPVGKVETKPLAPPATAPIGVHRGPEPKPEPIGIAHGPAPKSMPLARPAPAATRKPGILARILSNLRTNLPAKKG